MPKFTVTNPRKSARTIFTASGQVKIMPGYSANVELTDAQAESEAIAGMTVNKIDAPEGKPEADKFDAMSDDDLREFIEAETGEKPHWKAKRKTLLSAARGV